MAAPPRPRPPRPRPWRRRRPRPPRTTGNRLAGSRPGPPDPPLGQRRRRPRARSPAGALVVRGGLRQLRGRDLLGREQLEPAGGGVHVLVAADDEGTGW